MRWLRLAVFAACMVVAASWAGRALATSPVTVAFGASWDPPAQSLQNIVDTYVGIPGAVNVQTDYVGAHLGDYDPWFWVGAQAPALLISEVAGNANLNVLGWYREEAAQPVIDDVNDGVLFDGPQGPGTSSVVMFPGGRMSFGFYLKPPAGGGPQQYFFTNRKYNDRGLRGAGATHEPFDGDMQALVFDVSRWKGTNTWLVCFEDLDSGAPVSPCCTGTDNDFNDFVFEISAFGATPTQRVSFGALKLRFAGR